MFFIILDDIDLTDDCHIVPNMVVSSVVLKKIVAMADVTVMAFPNMDMAIDQAFFNVHGRVPDMSANSKDQFYPRKYKDIGTIYLMEIV